MRLKGELIKAWFGVALMVFGYNAPAQTPSREPLVIGTGGQTGVYYPTGGAICRLINRDYSRHGIRCRVESTEGSVYNLEKIRSGELRIAIVQSDWQFHAYHGSDKFLSQGPNPDLRSVFSLHSEPFTVIARKDSGIRTFDELKGKRVNIGNPGSGQRATMGVLMEAKGWDPGVFGATTELQAADQIRALCDGEVDAIVYTVGHPNSSVLEATTACDSLLVAVTGEAVDRLVDTHPYYAQTRIPGGMYRGNPEDIPTFGVKATLVAAGTLDEEAVYQTVRSVFEGFDEFRRLHPALANLDRKSMVNDGNSAPLHPGAERYYRETGLLEN